MSEWFHAFATKIAALSGRWQAFVAAGAILLLWLGTGPFFGFSDGWQLFINSLTTIITFLMVFLIQHTQHTQEAAMQAKLDELIRAVEDADNRLIGIEGTIDG